MDNGSHTLRLGYLAILVEGTTIQMLGYVLKFQHRVLKFSIFYFLNICVFLGVGHINSY